MFDEEQGRLSDQWDEFTKSMNAETRKGLNGELGIGSFGAGGSESGRMLHKSVDESPRAVLEAALAGLDPDTQKAVGPDILAALGTQLQAAGDVTKEWTLTTPLTTGLVPFDLEAPAKLLAPRPTPWRNMFPRIRGYGQAHRIKSIQGFSGSNTGGISTINPGITESTTNAGPGGLAMIRGSYINYAATDTILAFVQSSLSDSVSWAAEYQGQGFEDIRSLSNTVLLYASMLAEERTLVYGRGTTGNGYVGALAAAPTPVLTAVSASVGAAYNATALTAGNYWVIATADAGQLGANHEGPASAAASVNVGSGQIIQVSFTSDVTGALGYNLYAASVNVSASGNATYQGRTGSNLGFIGGYGGSSTIANTGPTITAGAADTSANATNYDGVLTNLGSLGGYVTRLNAPFSTVTPGAEFQNAFASLYDSTKADPDAVWMNGFDRKQLSNALQSATAANPSNYRLMIGQDEQTGVFVGAMVSHLVNEVTGKSVEVNVHPWIPQGNATVQSYTLPMPDSNVTNTWSVVAVQDYISISWPVTQFTYDASTYWNTTLASYAPAFSGLISGIQRA
jgi:hypothetical protein